MSARLRVVLVAVALLALGGAAVAVVRQLDNQDHGPAAEVSELQDQGPGSQFKGAVRPAGLRAGGFSLRDQNGRRVTLSGLRGRVVVLSPMYTRCRDTCPIVAQQINDALNDLTPAERSEAAAFALSVDPAHDTPRSARRFLRTRHVEANLDFLLGSSAKILPIWRAYGFSPQTEKFEHNSYVVLIDRRGFQRVGFPAGYLTPESLTHDIRILVRERG